MKKLVLLLAAITMLAACNRNKLADFSIKTLKVCDSVQFTDLDPDMWYLSDKSFYTCEVDEPVTRNHALKDSILAWMRNQMIDTIIGSDNFLDLMKVDMKVSLEEGNTEPAAAVGDAEARHGLISETAVDRRRCQDAADRRRNVCRRCCDLGDCFRAVITSGKKAQKILRGQDAERPQLLRGPRTDPF